MVMTTSTYEDLRLQRMEENKKRIEDLKLNQFAISFNNKVKQSKPRVLIQKTLESVPVRRSNRLSGKPAPVYEEVFPISSDIDRQNATRKAESLCTNLTRDDGFPCFVKTMLPSYVSHNCGFALRGLPRKHLPKCDETITLVDQLGEEEFPTKYIAKNNALCSGWRGFAQAHDLIHGDSLVFQLVEPTKFKIHIIRANRSQDERNDQESS